jgi:hypothetical protein
LWHGHPGHGVTRAGRPCHVANQRPARLVGAPLVGARHKGTHEGCPYESVSAEKTFAIPGFGLDCRHP